MHSISRNTKLHKLTLFLSLFLLISIFCSPISIASSNSFSNIISTVEGGTKLKQKVDYGVNLVIRGQAVTPSYKSYIKIETSEVMAPIKLITDHFGLALKWDKKNYSIRLTAANRNYLMKIGEHTGSMNGMFFFVRSAPEITDSTIMIPTSFLAEILGVNVKWDGKSRTLYLGDEKKKLDPAPLKDRLTSVLYKSLSINGGNAVAVRQDGTLWAWGELYEKPTLLLKEVKDAQVGTGFGIALKTDGTVWAWGKNMGGALGNGTIDGKQREDTPQQVEGVANVQSIEIGGMSVFAVREDGTVVAWGSNSAGKLGLGRTYQILYPTPFQTKWENVKQLSSGSYSTIVLLRDGTVWQTSPDYPELEQIKELKQIQSIANGQQALALSEEGKVYSWNDFNYPGVHLVPGLPVISSINAGMYQYFALTSEGNLYSWGNNLFGELGMDDSETNGRVPVFNEKLSPVRMAVGGFEQSLFVTKDEKLLGVGNSPNNVIGPNTYKSWDATIHDLAEIVLPQ
ncbi:stalk domain-containing protein [Cohnella herbarum]|uniref:Copper amine oxidase-like N-terminal domain-containing protein n=1 Tax=Cohnella herbarum TaxID=2728023 RepID=A0A7Z2VN53_9BACL|nr:stalk domain-containing protein [Cohnella herbarum]QJD86358.1 hypothetical protein HH215_26460 [Cohnella herbarum]